MFTDADVRDPEIAAKVGRAAEKAYQEACNAGVTLSPPVELGLEFVKDGDAETWGYYFADCASRDIFWFEDNESHPLMSNVRGVQHISHVSQYLLGHTTYSSFAHDTAPRVCNRNAILVRTISVVRLFPCLSKQVQ